MWLHVKFGLCRISFYLAFGVDRFHCIWFIYLVTGGLKEPHVELPVKFKASEPGHYPCQITLKSAEDIRVYKVECTVNPEGNTAEIKFSSPVHQSVSQEIPIVCILKMYLQFKSLQQKY